ncbi:MAG: GspH/FimT family pseudopilin [Gemmatimonadota bacterium]
MLRQPPKTHQLGITLVEFMTTVGIVSVLAGVAAPNFAAWQASTRIRASADIIHAGLRLARSEAVVRNTNVVFTLQPDGSWNVGCETVTTNCPATLHTRPGAEIRGDISLAVTQLNAESASGASSVLFNSRGTPDSAPASLRTVDITAPSVMPSAPGRQLRVTLSAFGQTRLCDPNAGVGSPTSC